MYSFFVNDPFFNLDWNQEFNLESKKEKLKTKHYSKKSDSTFILNPNFKIKDQTLKPYLLGTEAESCSANIEKGILKIDIIGLKTKLPIKLKPFGDLDVDWTFKNRKEIVFELNSQKFKGNAIGYYIDKTLIIDLIERKDSNEHTVPSVFNLSYKA